MQSPFGDDDKEESLPPPFHHNRQERKKDDDREVIVNPVSIGKNDKEPTFGKPASGNGGMIMGPEHSIFKDPPRTTPSMGPSFLPSGAVPPGARFDPITPMAPVQGPHGELMYPSGEPDPDELPPPGGNARLQPGWRPPKSGGGGFGKSGGAPFFH